MTVTGVTLSLLLNLGVTVDDVILSVSLPRVSLQSHFRRSDRRPINHKTRMDAWQNRVVGGSIGRISTFSYKDTGSF